MCLSSAVFFAVLQQAAQAVSAADGPFYGMPPWLVVLIGTLIAVVVLWIFAKLLKWTIWIVIFIVLIGGVLAAAKMLLGL